MEKKNGILAKGIAAVLAAIILINDVVGLFVTKQDHPFHASFWSVHFPCNGHWRDLIR